MEQEQLHNSFPPHLFNGNAAIAIPKKVMPAAKAFVWPVLNKACFRLTMDNYREWRNSYNENIVKANASIAKYNNQVLEYIQEKELTPSTVKTLQTFTKQFAHLPKRAYNQKVQEFNNRNGLVLQQLEFLPLKNPSELVFQAILHAYTTQLQKQVSVYKQLEKRHATTLPKCAIHPYELSHQKRNNGYNLDFCSRTIRNHRDRLEEAGILKQKQFNGTSRPCEYFINPQILCVIEGFTDNFENPENQTLSVDKRKKVPYIKVSTCSTTKELKKKGIVNNPEITNASLSSQIDFYLSTKPQDVKTAFTTPTQKCKPGAKNSPAQKNEVPEHAMLDQIEGETLLKQKLTKGVYTFYTPLDTKILQHLKATHAMSNEQYRSLCVQDFIKTAAHIWPKGDVYEGSWLKAMRHVDTIFGCRNFTGTTTTKQDVYNKLMQFRYRLRWATNWIKKNEFKNVRYPNNYFDPSFTHHRDVSFAFTKKVWNKEMQRRQKIASDKQKALATAKKRDRVNKELDKKYRALNNAIYRYLNKEIDYTKLVQLVTKLPQSMQEKFPDRLAYLNERYIQRNSN